MELNRSIINDFADNIFISNKFELSPEIGTLAKENRKAGRLAAYSSNSAISSESFCGVTSLIAANSRAALTLLASIWKNSLFGETLWFPNAK